MSTPPLTVFCPTCSTKFSVADHIVRGKFVKFRCKKCQGTIECDGRALSSAPPAVRASARAPASGVESARKSEPPMRLSISDGLAFDAAAASLAPPKIPQLAPPPTFSHADAGNVRRPSDPFGLRRPLAASQQAPAPLFTAPPTAVSQGQDLARLQTGDTPVEGHTSSDFPRSAQEGTGKTWRRMGVLVLVAAAGVGGWILARQSAPPSATSAAMPPAPEAKHDSAIDPGKAAATDLANPTSEPAKTLEPTKASETAKAIAPAAAPMKVIDPTAPAIARPQPKVVAKAEAPPAAVPVPANAAPAAEPTADVASAMAAVSNEHEFNKDAARSALEDAADHAASCRNIDTPAGAARVAVTFAPSGKVTSAVIESGPLVGTASGGCVASKFRNLHIPAFTSDDPITVHKTVSF